MKFKQESVLLLIVLITLASCKAKEDCITVKGRAYSWKRGAYIRANKKNYYINGLYSWPVNYHEKKLIVKGKLRIIRDTVKVDPNDEKQRFFGDMYIIDSAVYKVSVFGKKKKPFKEKTRLL